MPAGPEILIVALVWLVPIAFVWTRLSTPTDRSVAAFAKTYAVPLTTRNVEQLRRYIGWTRRWRISGAFVAFGTAMTVAILRTESVGTPWLPLVVGYSLGSVLGEILRPAERIPDQSLASLQRRRIVDFIRPGYLIALSITYVLGLIPAAWLLLSNPRRSWVGHNGLTDTSGQRPQDWFVLAMVAATSATMLLCIFGGRALARAPFPADSPDRQAVRHAIRSAAVLSMVGGASMICGGVMTKLAWPVYSLADSGSVIAWFAGLSNFVGLLVATWGALITLTSIPYLAPFAGRLPAIPHPDQAGGA